MLNKSVANDVLLAAVSTGGDFAEIFVENNVKNAIGVINGKVEAANSGTDFGVGLRVFCGNMVVYSYTNKSDKKSLLDMAIKCAQAIKGNSGIEHIIYNEMQCVNNHAAILRPSDVSKKEIVDYLIQAHMAASGFDSLITQTNIKYSDSTQNILVANTEGLWAEDERIRTRLSVSAVASNEYEKQTGYFGPGALKGFEFCRDTDIKAVAREAARSAVTMLKAGNCPSGQMPVIIDNGFGGVIFHEACGHGLEACAVAKNASVFAGKIGKKIASEKVTAIDDGTIANSWGSINIDDEGHKSTRNVLIENGILKNYMVDKYSGKILGMKPTGSARRQSYKFEPVSRMTNTFIAAGSDDKNDIIADTEYGLYAKYMGGGSVNPASGEFNFAVNEAYIIRNGKICEPVRGATLIGKGSEVLMDIDRVSDNIQLAEGMCGASSGSIPVCVGQPMIRVKNMTVGGRA